MPCREERCTTEDNSTLTYSSSTYNHHLVQEGSLQVRRFAHAAASTAWHWAGTIVGSAVVGAWLGAEGAVHEGVASLAGVAGVALEDASIHVGGAFGRHDLHAVTTHVDFAGDVDGRVAAAEGALAPGVEDLTVVKSRVAVDGGPRAREAVCEGHEA